MIPGAHPYFAISDHRIGAHSPEFNEAAHSEYGLENMLKAAQALAYSAITYLTDEEFRERVKNSF